MLFFFSCTKRHWRLCDVIVRFLRALGQIQGRARARKRAWPADLGSNLPVALRVPRTFRATNREGAQDECPSRESVPEKFSPAKQTKTAVWPCTSHPGTVNRSFLLGLERDKAVRFGRMKEKMKKAAIT